MIKREKLEIGRWIFALVLVLILVGAYFTYPWLRTRVGRVRRLGEWLNDPSAHADWSPQAGKSCGSAPFIMPTSGYVGFIWGDSFRPGNRHQGVDIFGGDAPGKTPVLAAYSGYLTRLAEWKSTVIIRIPADPLNHTRQIWAYYTHMADQNGTSYISPQFPPGTSEATRGGRHFPGVSRGFFW